MDTSDCPIDDEVKEWAWSKREELEWVDDVGGFECCSCGQPLLRHYTGSCGHKLCPSCKETRLKEALKCPLPSCGRPITHVEFELDFEFERKLYDMRVRCPNHIFACPFVGQLKNFKVLKQVSMFNEKFDKLSAEFNGKLEAIRAEVAKDVKEIKAKVVKDEKALKTDFRNEIGQMKAALSVWTLKVDAMCAESKQTQEKQLAQEMWMDQTTLKLSQTIEALPSKFLSIMKPEMDRLTSTVDKHSDEIEQLRDKTSHWLGLLIKSDRVVHDIKTEVDNRVKGFEVENRKLNEECSRLNERIKDVTLDLKKAENHAGESIDHLKTTIVQSNPQMDCFNLCERNINIQPDYVWKIKGIKELVKQETFEVKSEVFTWNGYPVNAQAQLEVKQDNKVHVSLNMKEHNGGEAIDFKPIPHVYYVIRDQSNNAQTKHIIRLFSLLFSSKFNYSFKFDSTIAHISWLIKKLYNVDDSVMIEIYVEPPHMANEVYSYDGLLSWSVDNCRKRKQMEQEELVWRQESPYFYTGPRGYRVQADVYLDGFREHDGKGLTIQINFLSGEFDAELVKSFPHQTTVTLLNRKYPELSITKRVDQNIKDKQWYLIDMCSNAEIDDLLENDTLFYNIVVKSIE